jgi:PKD repeat protein
MRNNIFALVILFSGIYHCSAQLSGNYTIDSAKTASSKNYKNFTSAVNDLVAGSRTDGGTANGKGVSGPVIFNVADGIYVEQIVFKYIKGASSTNTITFQSASGDSSKAVLSYPAKGSTANNYAVMIDGASYLTFRQLGFRRTGTDSNANIFSIYDSAGHCSFMNNQFLGSKSQTPGGDRFLIYFGGTLKYSSPYFIHDFTFSNNLFRFGNGGIYDYSTMGNNTKRFNVSGNVFDSSFNVYSNLTFTFIDTLVINNNTIKNGIQSSNKNYKGSGILIDNGSGLTVTRNIINMPIAATGLSLNTSGGTTYATAGNISNNFVSSYSASDYYVSSVDVRGCKYMLIQYNNFLNYGNAPKGTTFEIGDTKDDNIVKFNNIVNLAGGYAVLYDNGIDTSDYNNFYTNGPYFSAAAPYFNGDFAGFCKAYKCDKNSSIRNPYYVNIRDLHIRNIDLKGKGLPVSQVKDDIDSDKRNSTHPDIGADEFIPLTVDAGLAALSASGGSCKGDIIISATVKNNGTKKLDSVNITWFANGKYLGTKTFKLALTSGNDTTIIVGKYYNNLSQNLITAYVSQPNGIADMMPLNDTFTCTLLNSLSGNYTIGSTGATYHNFTEAINDIIVRGVCGPVVFTVADGNYAETLNMHNFRGTSYKNTILFQSASADSSKTIISYTGDNNKGNTWLVYLDSVAYVTFSHIGFVRTGDTIRNIIRFSGQNNNHNISFQNSYFQEDGHFAAGRVIQNMSYQAGKCDSIFISNNYFKKGIGAVYFEAGSHIFINNNIFDGFQNGANIVEITYVNGITANGNRIFNTSGIKPDDWGFTAIGLSYDSVLSISKNQIYGGKYFQGIIINGCNGNKKSPAVLSNNMISTQIPAFTLGIFTNCSLGLSSCNNMLVLSNSVFRDSPDSNAFALLLNPAGTNTKLKNNIAYITGKGFGCYADYTHIDSIWHNDFFSPNNASLYKLLDSTNRYLNPIFYSSSDLHTGNIDLKHTTTPDIHIPDDADGDKRDIKKPDIGADEFKVFNTEAGLADLYADPPCFGPVNVMARVKNNGLLKIDSVYITLYINNKFQSARYYNVSVKSDSTRDIKIGTISNSYSANVMAVVSNPNGHPDSLHSNDTMIIQFQMGMHGTYTIGGSGADYPTFAAAVADLRAYGICNPVIFNVASGTYKEQLDISRIRGTSLSNTITFQSAAHDSTKVILTYPAQKSNTNNFLLRLTHAQSMIFRQLTFTRSGTDSFANLIYLNDSVDNITFSSNRFIGNILKNQGGDRYGIYTSYLNSNPGFEVAVNNNMFKYLDCGAYLAAPNSNKVVSFSGNIFDSLFLNSDKYVLYLSYINQAYITGNTFQNSVCPGRNEQIVRLSYSPLHFRNNKVEGGIEVYNGGGSLKNYAYLINNFISCGLDTFISAVDIYNCNYLDIYFNNILRYGAGKKTNAMVIGYPYTFVPNAYIKNNNFVNAAGGYALYCSVYDSASNNNFYSATRDASHLGNNTGANFFNLDPEFNSNTDLHIRNALIKHKALPISGIVSDIDGDVRDLTRPDIGADEEKLPVLDIALLDLLTDGNCPGLTKLSARVYNNGNTRIDSLAVSYSVNGIYKGKKYFKTSILPLKDSVIDFGSFINNLDTSYIHVYLSGPNGQKDSFGFNDSIFRKFSTPMSGKYYIGGAHKNFSSFNDAVANLLARGVCGPVKFYAVDSNYFEKVHITSVKGASAINTISFTSLSGDSSKVILEDSTTIKDTLHNYTVWLQTAAYISFDKISITRSSFKKFYHGIVFINGISHHNSFTNCSIYGAKKSCNCTDLRYDIYDEGLADSVNIFRNNHLKYGAGGIIINNRSYSNGINNLIENNIIDSLSNSGGIGIMVFRQDSCTIRHNKFSGVYNACISLSHATGSIYVMSNYINATCSSGISSLFCIPIGYKRIQIADNILNITPVDGKSTAFYFQTIADHDIDFNTIIMNPKYPGNYMINAVPTDTTAKVIDQGFNYLYNNIFISTLNPVDLMEISYKALTYNVFKGIDYNSYYYAAPSAFFGYFGYVYCKTFADWQTQSGFDSHSIFTDPRFKNKTDYHPKAIEIDGKALKINTIKTDFADITRASKPDIGALEFDPPKNDLYVVKLINADAGNCGDSAFKPAVIISNEGTADQSNFTVYAEFSGAGKATVSQVHKNTLKSGKADTLFFNTSVNTFAGGYYTIKTYTALSNDEDRTNDTAIQSTYFKLNTPAPSANSYFQCGTGYASPVVSSGTNTIIQWYDSLTGGKLMYTGNPFPVYTSKTDTLFATSTSFSKNSLVTDFKGTTSTYSGNMFEINASADVIIDSFAINTGAAAPVRVDAYYKLDTLNSYQTVSSAWYNFGSYNAKGQGAGNPTIFSLGAYPFKIPHGRKYSFYFQINKNYNAASVYTTASVSAYANADIQLSNCTALTGSFSGPQSNTGWNGTLYYHILGCTSARVPVPVILSHLPAGGSLKTSSVSNGYFYTGSASFPDNVCQGSTITYEIIPPTGYYDSTYGKTWVVSTIKIKPVYGSSDTTTGFFKPTATAHATWYYTAGAGEADGLFKTEIAVRNLATGCDTILSRYFKVTSIPKADFTFSNVCNGIKANFIDKTSGISGGFSGRYLYYFGDGDSSTDQNPTHVYHKPGTYKVKQFVYNQNQCFDTLTRFITIYPVPQAGFKNSPICQNRGTVFTDTSRIASGNLTYHWDFGDGDTSVLVNPVHNYKTRGKYFITLTVKSQYGCTDAVSKYSTVNVQPTVSFAISDVCFGESAQFTNYSTDPSLKYLWEFGDGDSSAVKSPLHSYLNSGIYKAKLVGTNTFGCLDSVTHPVSVYSLPVPDFKIVRLACSGNASRFIADSGKLTGYKYLWKFSDNGQDTSKSVTHVFSKGGPYTITLQARNANGCTDSILKKASIPATPVALFSKKNNCFGQKSSFTDQSTGSPVDWIWNFGTGDTSGIQNPSYSFSKPGKYLVSLKIRTAEGCTDSAADSVTIFPLPSAKFSHSASKMSVSFVPADSSNVLYAWSFGDSTYSKSVKPSHTYASNGIYNIRLGVKDSNACFNSSTDTVNINWTGIPYLNQQGFSWSVYPNPFENNLTLVYNITEEHRVSLTLSDITGKQISIFAGEKQEAGNYRFDIKAEDFHLSPGLYLLKLGIDDTFMSNKIIKLR